jgi:hypothetical protein
MQTIQQRNLLQEVVMWLVGVVSAIVAALVWSRLERIIGVSVDYRTMAFVAILLFAGCAYAAGWIRKTNIGVIRKGIIYGSFVGVVFMAFASVVTLATGG